MYLGAEVVDLVGGEGDRSVWGLWGRVDWMVAWGNGGGRERDGNLWDIGRGTVGDGGVAICQLTAGVAWEENVGGKGCEGRFVVDKFASHTCTRLLRIGGVPPQICLELGEELEDFLEFRACLGCMTHGSELTGTLGQSEHEPWRLAGGEPQT